MKLGDGISDLMQRNECSEAEAEEYIRNKIRDGGCITWWPGGFHHSTISRMINSGELLARNVSTPQETKFEVYLNNPRIGG